MLAWAATLTLAISRPNIAWPRPVPAILRADEAELARIRKLVDEEPDNAKKVVILQNALAARKTAGDVQELSFYNLMLGDAYLTLEKTSEAYSAFRAAIPWLDTRPGPECVGRLVNIAHSLVIHNDVFHGAFFLKRAVETARTAKLPQEVAENEIILGNIVPVDAEKDAIYARAVEDALAAEMPHSAGDALAELAYAGIDRKDYRRAIHYFEAALAIPEWNDYKYRSGARRYILLASGYSGDWTRAKKYGSEIEKRYLASGEDANVPMVISDIGFAAMNAHRYADAIPYFRRAFAKAPESDRNMRATIRFNEGFSRLESGAYDEALVALEDALTITTGVDEARAANCESSIGVVLLRQGKAKDALPRLLSAEKRGSGIEDFGFWLVTYQSLLRCYRQLGMAAEAKEVALKVDDLIGEQLNTLEIERVVLGNAPSSAKSRNAAYLYGLAAEASLGDGYVNRAFIQAEKAKARTIVDLESRTTIDRSVLTSFEQGMWDWLKKRAQAATASQTGLKFALEELDNYESYLRGEAARRKPGGIVEMAADRVKLDEIEDKLAAVPPDTVLLQVVQSEQVSVIMAWSEGGTARFAGQTLMESSKPVSPERLAALSEEFALSCMSSGTGQGRGSAVSVDPTASSSGESLRAILIEPLRARLSKFKRIVCLPADSTWRMPLEALPIGKGETVMDRWQVDYAYSATQWIQSSERRVTPDSQKPMLVVSNPSFGSTPAGRVFSARGNELPELPGTKLEAARIRDAMPAARSLSGPEANAERVRPLLGDYGLLHFATHGLFDPINPMASSLAFSRSPGGAAATEISAQEIQGMSLTARLAVLSACDTGRGEFRPGTGPIGLTYAFLKAGCPVVISSRWSVSDATTADLMGNFYAGLGRGVKIGEAFRSAVLKTKRKHPQPYYWAPFMVVGDSRK